MNAPPRRVAAMAAIGVALGGAALTMAVIGMTARTVALTGALAAVAAGLASIGMAHSVAPGEPDEEHREQRGPDGRQRRMILRAAIGTAIALVAVGAVPAWRRVDRASSRLRHTSWRAGIRVVDDHGDPVHVADTAEGQLLTVFPQGATDAIDSQAVLIREAPDRYSLPEGREGWAPDGIVAYSKLCTHMACPVGLYETEQGTLLCPCHQAVFDALGGGRAVRGPARRALPQLPLDIDDDGFLIARGDFSDTVGTGFWDRP